MKNEDNNLSLVESVKSKLRKEDQAVASHLDFSKSDDEIISSMKSADLLKFSESNKDDD